MVARRVSVRVSGRRPIGVSGGVGVARCVGVAAAIVGGGESATDYCAGSECSDSPPPTTPASPSCLRTVGGWLKRQHQRASWQQVQLESFSQFTSIGWRDPECSREAERWKLPSDSLVNGCIAVRPHLESNCPSASTMKVNVAEGRKFHARFNDV
jgi:hypothetical protein